MNISFPTAFTTVDYAIVVTMGYNSNPDASGYKKDTITKTSIRVGISGGYGSGIPLRWFAIGY